MRPRDTNIATELRKRLDHFDKHKRPLPGIRDPRARDALIEQLLESIHRVKYPAVISKRPISPARADPTNEFFDPLRAAILRQREGAMDEAFWFVFFLFTLVRAYALGGVWRATYMGDWGGLSGIGNERVRTPRNFASGSPKTKVR